MLAKIGLAKAQNSNATIDDAFLTPLINKTCLKKQQQDINHTYGFKNNSIENVSRTIKNILPYTKKNNYFS